MKKKALLLVPAMFGLLIGGCNKSDDKPASEEQMNPTTEAAPVSQVTPTSNQDPTSSPTSNPTSATTIPNTSVSQAPVSASSYVPHTTGTQVNPSSSNAPKSSTGHMGSSSYHPVTTSGQPGGTTSVSVSPSTSHVSTSVTAPIPQQFGVNFYTDKGAYIAGEMYASGTQITRTYEKPSDYQYTYSFVGWSETMNGDPILPYVIVIKPMNLFAIVSPTLQKYTVTFDSMGGSAVDSKTGDYGTNIDAPSKPKLEGYTFVGWSYSNEYFDQVYWPFTIQRDITLYAFYEEKVDFKGFFSNAISALSTDIYSFIPNSLRPEYVDHEHESAVTYDFSDFNQVNMIKYGGFGEQWRMVINNIREADRFFKVTSLGSDVLSASTLLINNFLDDYDSNDLDETFDETGFKAKISGTWSSFKYSIQYKSSISIPFFGDVTPQIDVYYDIPQKYKTVRIGLNENNAMKAFIGQDVYELGLKYGTETVSRNSYLRLNNYDHGVIGYIYEYVQYKDKELIPARAEFRIENEYTVVFGNKASGLTGFDNYIVEVYLTNEGKLLGYEIQETLSSIQYNTLWFNLDNIDGISSYKYADDKVYVNGSAQEFVTMKVGGLSAKTLSRRYDIEQRLQYFYDIVGDDHHLEEYETSIPMMFVQEEVLSDFSGDVHSKNSYLNVDINLDHDYLDKIKEEYFYRLPDFIENTHNTTSGDISDFIGNAEDLS